MTPAERTQAAIVAVHGVRVGQLDRVTEFHDYVFSFDHGWLEDPQRPILGQIFEDRRPDDICASGIPSWFAHLLPQGPWRRILQKWANLDPEENDDFDLLVAINPDDLPGAVTLASAVSRTFGSGGYATLRERGKTPGFSLSGAQTKLSVREGDKGLVVPVRGEIGSHIAKFHDPRFAELPRLEYATTLWAQRAGIRTHLVRLASVDEFAELPESLPVGDGKVFVAERFDRSASGKVHVEDFGQILDEPPGARQYERSYEDIALALGLLCPEDSKELIERITFVACCGNGDAHLKNWGVVYPDRRSPRLCPAYDLVATVARIPNDSLALRLAGKKDFASVELRSFLSVAEQLDVTQSEAERWALEARDRVLDVWTREGSELGFTAAEQKALNEHLQRLPFAEFR